MLKHNVLLHDDRNQCWLGFSRLKKTFSTANPKDVVKIIDEINELVIKKQYWAVGWLSYESAAAFDPALETHQATQFPLLWMSLFECCDKISSSSLRASSTDNQPSASLNELLWTLNISKQDYIKHIKQIKKEIRSGNTYQVNYTIRQFADMNMSLENLFLTLGLNARYGALIDTPRYSLVSASPELFFTYENNTLCSRPMKGTAPRGRFYQEDIELKQKLYDSQKNRAENLMIVDMIRNDIGKIAKTGSVKVDQLFSIEKYPTVWQMTSTVCAKLIETPANKRVSTLMKALFPCASITGAPKTNTMKIIRSLENTPRNIYTGTIGFISPAMQMQFNVAIRTVLVDKKYQQAEYGVGGGIVWDSQADDEFNECLIKSKVLSSKGHYTHKLLETLRWEKNKGYYLLDYHLERLKNSADYFDYKIDIKNIIKRLNSSAKSFSENKRVRLLVTRHGKIEITEQSLTALAKPYRLKLAQHPIDDQDIFYYHKTNKRDHYDYFKSRYPDFDDVLLFNQQGHVCESCIANVAVKVGNQLFTPPVTSGLLNGTYRQYLLDNNKIKEKIINKEEILKTKEVYLLNSVRKKWPVKLCI